VYYYIVYTIKGYILAYVNIMCRYVLRCMFVFCLVFTHTLRCTSGTS